MSCNSCNKAKDLLSCISTLTIGTIANLNTAVYVYIRNNTTGRLYRYETTSSNAGLVAVLINTQQWIPEHDHEVWITLQSATNIEEKINFTISATSIECANFTLTRVYGSDEAIESGVQTLTLES